MQIKISILNSFRHRYNTKDLMLQAGSFYYLDIDKREDRKELMYMLSGSYPYRHFIALEYSNALLDLFNISKMDVYTTHPEDPEIGRFYYNSALGKVYYYNGNAWVEWTGGGGGGTGGGTGTPSAVVPALFGDVFSTGFSNEVNITPGVIVDADISPTAGIKLSKLEVNPLNRANHIGVQPASTIVDFDAAVRRNSLSNFLPPTNHMSMANFRLMDLGAPVSPNDAVPLSHLNSKLSSLRLNDILPPIANYDMAGFLFTNTALPVNAGDTANKAYVDSMVNKYTTKAPVRLVATSNVSPMSGVGQNIDGRVVLAGDSILLNNQSDPRLNGIYIASAGAWQRRPDADANDELVTGVQVFATDGNLAGSGWVMTMPAGPTALGVSQIRFTQFTGIGMIGAGDGLYTSGNSLHVGGTPNRVTVTADNVDIASTYIGQPSITTLGTVTSGVWRATPIDIPFGGTGATNAADARANLGAAKGGANSDITSLNGLTTPLSIPQGGTGATTAPDARINLQAAKSGVNSDITQLTGLTTPLSITQGGTGANNAAAARVNLQAAKSGVNSDITQLTGLTVPISISQGGTGATTAPEARVNLGAVGRGLNLGAGGPTSGQIFSAVVNTGTEIEMQFRTLVEGNAIDLTQNASSVMIAVNPTGLDLGTLGGFIDLTRQVVNVLPIANGGTNATTADQARMNLGAVGTLLSVGSGIPILNPLAKTGAFNDTYSLRSIRAGANILISSTATEIEVALDSLDINTDLIGYPLTIANGGTGATTAPMARDNLGVVFTAANIGTGSSILGTVRDVTGDGLAIDLKGVKAASANNILVTSTSTDVELAVNPANIEINSLAATTPLAIAKGGTNATTAGEALVNLGGMFTMASLGGLSLVGNPATTSVAGSGRRGNVKGLTAASTKILLADLGTSLSIDINTAALDINQLSGYPLTIANGGTGATTAAIARDNLAVVFNATSVGTGIPVLEQVQDVSGDGKNIQLRSLTSSDASVEITQAGGTIDLKVPGSVRMFSTTANIPDSTPVVITHGLNTTDIMVQVRDALGGGAETIMTGFDILNITPTSVTIRFAASAAPGPARVVIVGQP